MAVFKIEDLTYYYPDRSKPSLERLNMRVSEGEFILVTGASGSGKSTLARLFAGLVPEFYGGSIEGKFWLEGVALEGWKRSARHGAVGIVFQDPERQLVMSSVEREIAFGLENLGLPRHEMIRRAAEVMTFLNLLPLRDQFTATLSGGEKQKLALASVIAMHPRILILDEPTSQLDPIAAAEIFNLVETLNREMGYTIILIEQRLERCFHLADRLIIMEQGKIICDAPPGEAACWQVQTGLPFIPPVARFFASLPPGSGLDIPLTVREGRRELQKNGLSPPARQVRQVSRKFTRGAAEQKKPLLCANGLWYSYPEGPEAVKGLSLKLPEGELITMIGPNGSGKSTLLKLLAGIIKPDRGKILLQGRDTRRLKPPEMGRYLGYLSQNPDDYLTRESVEEELRFTLDNFNLPDNGTCARLMERLALEPLRRMNPRDLSSGERQRVALASVLVTEPPLLLLDEPTRGLDYSLKMELGSFLGEIVSAGGTVVLVTHDLEFAVEYGERVVLLCDGVAVCEGPREILGESIFYAPQMARLFQGRADAVLTVEEGLTAIARGEFHGRRNG